MTAVSQVNPVGQRRAAELKRGAANERLDELQRLQEQIRYYENEIDELMRERQVRLEALVQEYGELINYSQIANKLKMSRARVTQLLSSNGRFSFLSWGSTRLTVVIGEHRRGQSPLRDRFDELAKATGLEFNYEHVGPGGHFDLNRPNLIIACGPSISPVVHTALQSDTTLTLKNDAKGRWCIVSHPDTDNPIEYRSYMDAPDRENMDAPDRENIDFGYLGRRRRPDGKGHYLCVAGIHLPGTLGALDFLANNLESLQKRHGRRQFSMLIRADFDDPENLAKVTGTEVDVSPF